MRVQLSIVCGAVFTTNVSTVTEAVDVTEVEDQRSARRARGRAAVIEALIDVLEAGGAVPTASTIAELAGVSSASLFRYFDSIEELQREAALEHFKRNEQYFGIPDIGVGTLDDRITAFVEARAELYRRTGPVARFGRARSLEVPFFADALRRVRVDQLTQVRTHFTKELAGLDTDAVDDIAIGIAALTSFESWELQHRDFGRDDRYVLRSWTSGVRALLGRD